MKKVNAMKKLNLNKTNIAALTDQEALNLKGGLKVTEPERCPWKLSNPRYGVC